MMRLCLLMQGFNCQNERERGKERERERFVECIVDTLNSSKREREDTFVCLQMIVIDE